MMLSALLFLLMRGCSGPLIAAEWVIQDARATHITAARGVAVREFPLERGHGYADYLLYVDGKAAAVIEAKRKGPRLPAWRCRPKSIRCVCSVFREGRECPRRH